MASVHEHQRDEDGEHDPDECEQCIERHHSHECTCRCGECCEQLIIETSIRDAEREPQIKEQGSPIYDDMSGTRELVGYLLNGQDGACVFFDRESRLCTVHETRPLVCRVYDCDALRPSETEQP